SGRIDPRDAPPQPGTPGSEVGQPLGARSSGRSECVGDRFGGGDPTSQAVRAATGTKFGPAQRKLPSERPAYAGRQAEVLARLFSMGLAWAWRMEAMVAEDRSGHPKQSGSEPPQRPAVRLSWSSGFSR